MSEPEFTVSIDPGRLHFNAAHFITFNNACENLHGHNFHTKVEALGDSNRDGYVLDFVQLTELAAGICVSLDAKVLLPGHSSVVTLDRDSDLIHVRSCGRHYTLPADSCVVLPISNTTAELLAWYICDQLLRELRTNGCLGGVRCLRVAVEEADRQWGIYQREVDNAR